MPVNGQMAIHYDNCLAH